MHLMMDSSILNMIYDAQIASLNPDSDAGGCDFFNRTPTRNRPFDYDYD